MSLIRIVIISLNFILISLPTFALPTDRTEKIYIVSDRSTYNYKTRTKIFEGNVKVDQGTTHLLADKLITKDNQQHIMAEMIAYGVAKPAHYWTIPKENDQEIHAHAMIIKFYPPTSNVVLEKNVRVTQGDNSFQGEMILYNIQDQTVTVPPSKNGRALLIYDPNK